MVTTMESTTAPRTRAQLHMAPHLPAVPAHDEYCVDFDRTMIVYSDHTDAEENDRIRLSPITALLLGDDSLSRGEAPSGSGETAIGCYQGARFVGSINFYGNREHHPESNVDPNGLVHLWYPLACFPHVLALLHHEKNLSLLLICADLDGTVLTPPMGALLTWPEPIGRETSTHC